ncbi:hypothetical protein [Candidatus Oleimmundimicrobium sp.]|uniref:hypothetical protein n=1 Tax=Candidatus Oleimmundimicrobium sp. TaxID=3060597 RepID=UPI00271D5BCA|nr:hypothetical protein [Candidatus Oleimmundimicrobium sp.]MDO8886269.1 hypothetical protein [Candidatus Oleimmundimicrobium sp.]
MEFKPSCLPMAVGSMPHMDAVKACEVILKYTPQIPAWPQLPNLSFKENMCTQVSEGMPAVKIDEEKKKIYLDAGDNLTWKLEQFYEKFLAEDLDYFEISADYARGFHVMFDTLKKHLPSNLVILKGQLTGPISFGLTVTDQNKQAVLYNDFLRDAIIKTLMMKAKWQERQFKKLSANTKTIIFFDEPYLQSYGSAYIKLNKDEVVSYLNECFSAVEGLCGVHCCGRTDWSILMETNVNIISFDAYDHTESVALYPKELNKFLNRGGVLAWGIVPSTYPTPDAIAKETLDSILNRFEEKIQLLVDKGIDKMNLLEASLITPNCGAGSMTEELAEKSIRLTSELSLALRERYFGR